MANNLLYENIQINYHLLKTYENKFILSSIMNSIIYYIANQHKREGYIIDLNDGNFENDFDVVIMGTSIERNHINSGCKYNDIDDLR